MQSSSGNSYFKSVVLQNKIQTSKIRICYLICFIKWFVGRAVSYLANNWKGALRDCIKRKDFIGKMVDGTGALLTKEKTGLLGGLYTFSLGKDNEKSFYR